MNSESFTCPNCKRKLPFKYVLKIANNHEFKCPKCSAVLKPRSTKSWAWGAVIGFLSVVIPAQLYLMVDDNIVVAILIGLMLGSTSVFLIALLVYRNTYLTK